MQDHQPATTCREALWLAERGVDAIIAQGAEAGGHCCRDPTQLARAATDWSEDILVRQEAHVQLGSLTA